MGIESAIGGALISGASSLIGGAMTNEANADIAAAANSTQIELANTAHQREVADLKAAGLNPILSAGGSGAATPSMHVPTMSNVIGDAMNQGVTNFSALQGARQTDALIDKSRSETRLNNALALSAAATANSANAAARVSSATAEEKRMGFFGKFLGSSASKAIADRLDSALNNVASDITTNSAKKVKPPVSVSKPISWREPDGSGTWARGPNGYVFYPAR
nr:MAG: DNA pilot protein [Microvirus sp.]